MSVAVADRLPHPIAIVRLLFGRVYWPVAVTPQVSAKVTLAPEGNDPSVIPGDCSAATVTLAGAGQAAPVRG